MKWSMLGLVTVLMIGMTEIGNACEKCGGEKHPPRKMEEILLAEATFARYPAMLCGSCGFGSKKDRCSQCGKWTGNSKIPAVLCSSCGFGNKQEKCVQCGKWIGTNGIRAVLCNSCGFGNKKDNCVRCGRWATTPRNVH